MLIVCHFYLIFPPYMYQSSLIAFGYLFISFESEKIPLSTASPPISLVFNDITKNEEESRQLYIECLTFWILIFLT